MQIIFLLVLASTVSSAELQSDLLDYLGKTVSVFNRFGFLSQSIRVFPRNLEKNDSWVIREPTGTIFKNKKEIMDLELFTEGFKENFQLYFCETKQDLLEAYFSNIKMAGIKENWKALVVNYQTMKIEQDLGIEKSYFDSQYQFVLVRLVKPTMTAKLVNDTQDDQFKWNFKESVKRTLPGNVTSCFDFIGKYGSHIINTVELGDILYQIFVFKPNTLKYFKHLYTDGYKSFRRRDNMAHFSPRYAEHVGKIKVLSGTADFEPIANKLNLVISSGLSFWLPLLSLDQQFHSIFILQDNRGLLDEFQAIKDQTIIGIKLDLITSIISDTNRKQWLRENIQNLLKLVESNM